MRTDTNIITQLGVISGLLLGAAAVHAAPPPLEVLTPAGGETWIAGETVTLVWQATDPVDYVDIYLIKGGAWYASIGYVPMADGQMDWEICPALGDGDDYTLHMVGCDTAGRLVHAITWPFTITGSLPRPTLTVTSPAGGEIWDVSVSYPPKTIAWDSTDASGAVHIDLLRSGQLFRELGYVAADAGNFEWTPCCLTGDGNDYSIRLSIDACGPGLETTSEEFTIAGSMEPPVTVTSPVTCAVWPAGSPRQISWEAEGDVGDRVYEVDLYRNGVFYRYLGWHVHATGLLWTMDSRIGDDADYTIRVAQMVACGDAPEGFSIPFRIRTTDSDRDGDVDITDFNGFAFCFNGPNRPPAHVTSSGYCVQFDQDADGDVDLMDFANFQACFNGYNRPPRCP
ncbi:MAG: hypothetical protein JXA69_06115 [Phycisphaerae bacterium]|nr:hypothetical protein [Phycisphaerae bacterium]